MMLLERKYLKFSPFDNSPNLLYTLSNIQYSTMFSVPTRLVPDPLAVSQLDNGLYIQRKMHSSNESNDGNRKVYG